MIDGIVEVRKVYYPSQVFCVNILLILEINRYYKLC